MTENYSFQQLGYVSIYLKAIEFFIIAGDLADLKFFISDLGCTKKEKKLNVRRLCVMCLF